MLCVNVLLDVCMCVTYHGCLASAEVRKGLWIPWDCYLRYHVDARSWTWVLSKNKLLLTTELFLQGIFITGRMCTYSGLWLPRNIRTSLPLLSFFFLFLWTADLWCPSHVLGSPVGWCFSVQSLKLREVSKSSSFIDWTFLFSPRGWVGQW